MKKSLAVLLATLMFITSFGQRLNENNYRRIHTYDDYMEKSRKLKTAGFIMLGSGVGMLTGGIILFSEGTKEYNDNNQVDVNSKQVAGLVLIYAGTLCSLGSIPLLVVGSHFHKKAMRANAFLEMEKVPAVKITGVPIQPYPALGLKLNL
ncbi:MAG TPA: hypothetical protein VMT76_16205 [Puia sp.]|nr:hypothetical protein [Puia sp.]